MLFHKWLWIYIIQEPIICISHFRNDCDTISYNESYYLLLIYTFYITYKLIIYICCFRCNWLHFIYKPIMYLSHFRYKWFFFIYKLIIKFRSYINPSSTCHSRYDYESLSQINIHLYTSPEKNVKNSHLYTTPEIEIYKTIIYTTEKNILKTI